MDPSEDNLFDWGSELLLHRTYEPAIEVFEQARLRYPTSPRVLIGLGMALYSRGLYDDAVKALLAAADLNPADPRCYLFLSKAYDSSPNQAEEVIQRFRRYSELEPNNALAQYYYAMSLWKGKRAEDPGSEPSRGGVVAAKVDSARWLKLPEAHMQLGNLYADQHEYEKSIPEYVGALELNPNLPDAHYRLGRTMFMLDKKTAPRRIRRLPEASRTTYGRNRQGEGRGAAVRLFARRLRLPPSHDSRKNIGADGPGRS